MSGSLFIRNQQRAFSLNARLLRRLTNELLRDLADIDDFDLAIHLVRAPKMAEINERFLNHQGSTDVITLDYGDQRQGGTKPLRSAIQGEIFICLDDAREQAKQFRTTWQSEMVRYVVHGVLHLKGYDDLKPAARKRMKREENRLLKQIERRYRFRELAGKA